MNRPRSAIGSLLLAMMLQSPATAAAASGVVASPTTARVPEPAERVVLKPGEGLVRTLGAGRVLRTNRLDPRAPLRVIVELDAEPLVAARAQALSADAELPRRRLEQLRADLADLALSRPGTGGGARPFASITREYIRVFSGAAVTLDPALLERVRALPYVRGVFPDDTVRASRIESPESTGPARVQSALAGTGAGIRVGILDTGIDYEHEAFGGGFGPGFRVAGGWDFVDGDPDPRDDDGHGTHVAGIVAGNGGGVIGVAPDATLYAFKVLNSSGIGSVSTILAGLELALDPDQDPATHDIVHVVVCGFGARNGTPDDPMSKALDYLSLAGIVCVASAGDIGDLFAITSPGTSRTAITVGAAGADDALAAFSSQGPVLGRLEIKPDLLAPGENVVSAGLGGGTVEMSGTSMAAAFVAGEVARVRQLHSNWSIEDIKAALVGCSLDLQLSAFEQGAGEVQGDASTTATFTITPTQLAFGRIDDSVPVWTGTLALKAKNLTFAPHTVVFPESLALADGAMLRFDTDTVLVPPRGAGFVNVSLTVDNSVTPAPQVRPFGYSGTVEAYAGAERRRIPVSFHKAATLAVHHAAEDFGPSLKEVLAFQTQAGGFSRYIPAEYTGPAVLVPAGNYDLIGTFNPFGTLEIKEDVDVRGDVDLEFDSRNAPNTVTFENVDETGVPVNANRSSFALVHTPTGFGYDFLGFPFEALQLSSFSDAFRVQWTRTETNDRDRRVTLAGAFSGLAASQVIANQPGDLRHLAIEMPAPPVPSVVPFAWEFTQLGGDLGYLAIGSWNQGPPAITAPTTFDWWFTPAVDVGLVQAGFALDWYVWETGAALNLTQLAIRGARLRLDRGWPLEGYPRTLEQSPIFRVEGERMRLGTGPPVWRGLFQNSPTDIRLTGDHFTWFDDRHLVTDMYGTQFLEPNRPFTLSQDGVTVVADTLQGTGDFLSFGYFTQPAAPGTWAFHTDRPFSVGGQSALLEVTAGMDTRLADADPPSLRSLQLFADGEVVDSIAFAAAQDAGVRFHVVDGDSLTLAGVSVRASGSQEWTALAAVRDRDDLLCRLPPASSGLQDLRLESMDASGNSLVLSWTPAFFARPTIALPPQGPIVTFDGSSALLAWQVPGGAGLRFGLERREDAGAWSALGSSIADAGGVVSWSDSTVLPAHTYGYRASLANGGTPSYSPEVTFTISGEPVHFSLAGVKPNPALDRDLRVDFSLVSSARARLALFDLAGRRIVEREVGSLGAGPHSIVLEVPPAQRAGVYFLQLTQGSTSLSRRFCLLR